MAVQARLLEDVEQQTVRVRILAVTLTEGKALVRGQPVGQGWAAGLHSSRLPMLEWWASESEGRGMIVSITAGRDEYTQLPMDVITKVERGRDS